MSAPLPDSPGWTTWLAIAVLAYLGILLIRESLKHQGELRSAFLTAGLALMPSLIAALVLYRGRWALVFDRELALNRDPANWWVVRVVPTEGEPWFLNTLSILLTFAILYVSVTLLLGLLPALSSRGKRIELLSLHKALIKWPVVIAGLVLILNINLWPLLLGMGAASVVLGFALKEMLENLFTGMALDTEGAFHTGDWIRLGDSDTVGRVYEKHWRSTKILTLQDETITIPNRLLGAEKILSYNKPRRPFAIKLRVGASYNDPPIKVKEVLRTILMREPRVVQDPEPRVRTVAYADFSIEYQMKFWIEDYAEMDTIRDAIMTRIWYVFKSHGIQIPFPIRTLHHEQPAKLAVAIQTEVTEKRAFLDGLDFFNRHLAPRDFDFLAVNSLRRRYRPGEPVVQRNEIGDALYVVMDGFCEAHLPDGRKPRIQAGRYFGEMALLGGRKRTVDVAAGENGAVVMRIDRHCMDVLFRAHPDLLEEFEQIRDARREDLSPSTPPVAEKQTSPFLGAIRYLLRFLWPW